MRQTDSRTAMPATSIASKHSDPLPRVTALVPAAGRGLRMGGPVAKQFLLLGGQPLLLHSLQTLQRSSVIADVILAVPSTEREYCLDRIVTPYGLSKVRTIVPGGEQRQDSVRHALAKVPAESELVLVHDAVRPFVTETMIEQVTRAAHVHGAAIIALPMRDTVKQVGPDGIIQQTVDRRPLWLAQTPQAFRKEWLEEAHRNAQLHDIHATDDAYLVELLGRPVAVVEGSGDNMKITRPEDIAIGEAILNTRTKPTGSHV